MISLSLDYGINKIVLVAKDELAKQSLLNLAQIMELPPAEGELEFYDIELTSRTDSPRYYFNENGIGIVQHQNNSLELITEDYLIMIIMGVLRKLNSGENLFLLHCAVLEKAEKSVLLFGCSGIGKSTNARRFRATGGVCRGDDLALCYWENNKLYAKILPTFSALRSSENYLNLRYNFTPSLEVENLYLLNRGENVESIELNDKKEYLGVLIESMSSHLTTIWNKQPINFRQKCANQLFDLALEITQNFPPLTLKSHLENDISTMQIFYT